jgi:threonine synthase
VLVPEGKISMGKLSQAIAHGATLLQVDGNFDNCLDIARKLGESYPVFLVNSVNPARIQGQKTGAFEVVDALGDAPDIHVLPVGNAGNITAYWKGYKEYSAPFESATAGTLPPVSTRTPQMWGFQAAGAAPFVAGHPIFEPDTIATAIRIGNPASWDGAIAARDESGGFIDAVTDDEILAAHRWLSAKEGVFVEPGSAAGEVPAGKTIVITVTGHGLKDPQWALRTEDGSDVQPVKVSNDVVTVAAELGLEEK